MADMPSTIGRYQIIAPLGRGAMGVVYRGHDPEIDRPVAVKLIRTDLLASSERDDYRLRFRQEARAAGRCMHPNIVGLFDVGQHGPDPFLVMEFVEGQALDRAVRPGQHLALADAAALVQQVLAALDCAHRLGVVHRDIKPANLMLTAGGGVKVTDFGISRLGASELTQVGSILGTPGYMSPEQCQGQQVEPRSDLFAVAAILWELLAGQRAFAGSSVGEVVLKLMTQPPPDLAALRPDLPTAVHVWLEQGLAKAPGARFASASAMAAALAVAAGMPADHTVIMPSAAAPPLPLPAWQTMPTGPGTALGTPDMEALTRALAVYLGPIAKVLVKRTAPRAQSPAELRTLLAGHIERDADRAAFLRG